MAITGIEPIVKAVVDRIKADINSDLANVESVYSGSDPITLPRPLTTSYFISQKRMIPEYPAVIVLGERTMHGYQTGHAEYQTQDEGGGGHELTITWIHRDDNEERLRKILYRSARALANMFARDFDLGGSVMFIKVENEEFFGAVAFAGQDVFHQAVQLRLMAQTEEVI